MSGLETLDRGELRRALEALGADAWLLFNFHGLNPVAGRVLGLGGMGTRRLFVLIPREGKPVAVAHKIELQPLEFSLLQYLMRNAGRVISKTMIMEHVWNYNFDPQTNVVEARICRLRDKIDKGFEPKLLHTVRGVGYVIRQDP